MRRNSSSINESLKSSSINESLKKREVWWFVESYLQESEFQYALSKATHWAYIYHDKDDNEPHYHILLHYDNARSGNAVLRDFVGYQNSFIERCENGPQVCYEYLTHLNDPDKYQYNPDRIVSHNPIYWEHFLPSVRDRTQTDFIEDLLSSNELDIVYMAKKYGRDFIKNYKAYMDFRHEVKMFERFKN